MLKRLCFTVLLIIIFSISVFSSEELVFDSQMIRIEKLGEEQVLGDPVEISILNDDGSSYSKSAKIDISLGYTDGKIFDYRGLKYTPGDKNEVRFPFGILKKYDIIYLKALLEDGNTIETFYNIPQLNNKDRVKSMGLTEGVEIFDDTADYIVDCAIKTLDYGSIIFGYTVVSEDQIRFKNITFPADDPIISDLISITNEHSNGSIWDPRISSSGEIYYYKIWSPPYEIYVSSNWPESWSREGSYSLKSKFENGTPLFSEEDFFKVRMEKNLECHCYWFWPFPPIYEYEYNGYYKLFKEKGYEGMSIYSYHNTFAFDGNKTIYVTVNSIGHTKKEKCHGDAGEGWEVTEIVPRSENYEISLPGQNLEFDYHGNYITDVGIIDNVGKDSQTISFYVNNGVLNWSYSTELLSNPDCYNYRFNYIKLNDNEILIFHKDREKYSKNQYCIHITFPSPPLVSFLRDDTDQKPIIKRFEMPSENFGKYDFAQYYFKKDSSGKIHFLELYKYHSGGYKTRFYLGTFNNETYKFQKREIGNLDFNSFADFDIDNDGNIYVFYKSGEYTYPLGNDEVSIVKIEQESTPELSIKVYTDENCTQKLVLDTYYPRNIKEKLYVKIHNKSGPTNKRLKIHTELHGLKPGDSIWSSLCWKKENSSKASYKKDFIMEKNSEFSEKAVLYLPQGLASTSNQLISITITNIVITKVNDEEIPEKDWVYLELPKDDDDDNLPDVWEIEEVNRLHLPRYQNTYSNLQWDNRESGETFGQNWDKDPLIFNNDIYDNGDGFSALCEYCGYVSKRERLNSVAITTNPDEIKRMNSDKIDLFFIPEDGQEERFESNTILTRETITYLSSLNINVKEIEKKNDFKGYNLGTLTYLIIMNYEKGKANYLEFEELKKADDIDKVVGGSHTGDMGSGCGEIKIYENTLKGFLDLPDIVIKNNGVWPEPSSVDRRIGNWIHESLYIIIDDKGNHIRNPTIIVEFCTYKKDQSSSKENYVFAKFRFRNENIDDKPGLNWINVYDVSDALYNKKHNLLFAGLWHNNKIFEYDTEKILTRVQLHEIGHSMGLGYFDEKRNEIASPIILSYRSPSCMWYGIADPKNNMIRCLYSGYDIENYFNLKKRMSKNEN